IPNDVADHFRNLLFDRTRCCRSVAPRFCPNGRRRISQVTGCMTELLTEATGRRTGGFGDEPWTIMRIRDAAKMAEPHDAHVRGSPTSQGVRGRGDGTMATTTEPAAGAAGDPLAPARGRPLAGAAVRLHEIRVALRLALRNPGIRRLALAWMLGIAADSAL